MLKNLLIGPEKFVLFVDSISLQKQSTKLLTTVANDRIESLILPPLVPNLNSSTLSTIEFPGSDNRLRNVILQPIAHILNDYQPSALFQFIHKLKKHSHTKQLFGWVTVKNISDPLIISFLEHMCNILVQIKDGNHLTIVTKKSGGSVTKKLYEYEIRDGNFFVKEVKTDLKSKPIAPRIDPDSLASFKINVEEEEMVARNAVQLPYERRTEAELKEMQSRIIYQPDDDDDFDEEDPDDDLYI